MYYATQSSLNTRIMYIYYIYIFFRLPLHSIKHVYDIYICTTFALSHFASSLFSRKYLPAQRPVQHVPDPADSDQ